MIRLRSKLRAFNEDRSGSIALIFVLALFFMVFVIGIAIDMGRAQRASADVVVSIDAAALAGAKAMVEEEMSEADVTRVVGRHLSEQLTAANLQGAHYSNLRVLVDRTEGTVQIDVDVHVPTTFTRIAAKNTIDFHKFSKTSYKIKNVELAMVLDTTGSMQNNGKIDELKAAATQAVDILMPAGKAVLNRVALAPYAESVNVGPIAGAVSAGLSADCVVERAGADAFTDAPASSSPVSWVPLGGSACPVQAIMPLSKNANALKAAINAYATDGATAGHIGLAWGWYLISPNWSGQFSGVSLPKPYNDPKVIKAIILMTDGMFNKAYFNGPVGSGPDEEATSVAQTLALCDAAKAEGIKLYTIGFELASNGGKELDARNLLTTCASDAAGGGKEFYDATNGTDLSDAFKMIADKLSALRLSE
jgi:Flp pilus assembly protein TadG